MDTSEFHGRRVRLKRDAHYGQRIAAYLTDEQLEEGPQGVVVGSVTEAGRLFLRVDLENVPMESRHPVDDLELL